MQVSAIYRPLLWAAIVTTTFTGCRFDGAFNYHGDDDAGQAGHWSPPPDRDAGRQSGGIGGTIAGRHGGGTGGMSGGGGVSGSGGVSGGSEDPQGDAGGASFGGQGGATQGGSGSDQPPVAGQGDDNPVEQGCSPLCAAGETCCSGECVSLETNPHHCGVCGKDCSLRFSGDGADCSCAADANGWVDCRGPSLNVCTLGTGDLPTGGTGGSDAPRAGGGGSDAPITLELEVAAFSIKNEPGGLALVLGQKALGSVFYKNRNTSPVEVKQLVIAGRPPGGTHANGPYLDLIPLGGPITVPPGEPVTGEPGVTFSAFRTMRDTDPLGLWEFYPTWQDADNQWHDGPSLRMEVVAPAPPDDQDAGI